jgi:hypothetical protein
MKVMDISGHFRTFQDAQVMDISGHFRTFQDKRLWTFQDISGHFREMNIHVYTPAL